MWKWLKRIKHEPDKRESIDIPLTDVKIWLKSHEDDIFSKMEDEIREIAERQSAEVKKTKKNLKKLESSRLKNDKIPVREFQFMEGNRSAYIQKVTKFLENATFPVHPKDAAAHLDDFQESLQNFSKITLKPYQILQQYFANESRNVAINIKNLDENFSRLRNVLENAGLSRLESIKAEIEDMFARIRVHNLKRKEIIAKEEELQSTEEKQKKLEKKFRKLQNNNDMKNILFIREKLEETKFQIARLESEIRSVFFPLESPLKKFVRVQYEDEALTLDYMRDPAAAMKKDYRLRIISVLGRLKKAIESGTIDLKDSKRVKALHAIEGITDSVLRRYLTQLNGLHKQMMDMQKALDSSDVLKESRVLAHDMENAEAKRLVLKENITNLQKDMGKLSIDEMKLSVERRLSNLADAKLTLI